MLGRMSSFAGPASTTSKTAWMFRYYRFSVTKARDVTTDGSYATYNIVGITQLSEFELMFMGTKISYTGATVTNPGGANPSGQDVSKAVDGDDTTVWLDWR